MLDVHSSLKKYHSHQDPLVQVADSVARESKVLCLDEFFVNDVADAAILNRLFSRLWENGLVLVSTSNRAPDALYENGLQRNLFLPFIEKLKVCCALARALILLAHQMLCVVVMHCAWRERCSLLYRSSYQEDL